ARQVAASRAPASRPAERPSSSVTTSLPPIEHAPVSAAATFAARTTTSDGLGAEHRLLLWPWLLAAIALGAGGAFLFWRNRSRHAYAGGPQFDAFCAPRQAPSPRPAPVPAPPKAPPAAPAGIVSTRLRPWVELAFQPGRCIVE